MQQLVPFIVLLIVALLVNYTPMEAVFKHVCNVVLGIVCLLLVLRFAGIGI